MIHVLSITAMPAEIAATYSLHATMAIHALWIHATHCPVVVPILLSIVTIRIHAQQIIVLRGNASMIRPIVMMVTLARSMNASTVNA
jgi:hypothetical protein